MTNRIKLDKIDRNILVTLQEDARITNQKLSDKVNLSASACLTRVKRLEVSGLITGYSAKIDLEQLTPYIEAFAEITLENHSVEEFRLFDDAVGLIDQVMDSYKISGSYDYLVKFVCIDVRQYNDLTDQMIESGIGIEKINTLIILDNTKKTIGYPVSALLT